MDRFFFPLAVNFKIKRTEKKGLPVMNRMGDGWCSSKHFIASSCASDFKVIESILCLQKCCPFRSLKQALCMDASGVWVAEWLQAPDFLSIVQR